jgi:uncharacterized protein (AIM24 family)
MANFEIVEREGMRYVRIGLENETVRAESGALSSMRGNILMDVPLPSLGRILKSYLSEENYLRPTYTGTGEVLLEASFCGFYIFELAGETWILESGTYWASDGSVEVSAIRERAWTSFWAGEGFIDWQTKVSGHGKVALASKGRVDELSLAPGQRFVANGKCVIARSKEVSYAIARPTKSLMKTYMSGEGYCRCYDGPGRLLVSQVPFWQFRLLGPQPATDSPAAAA